jgi:hypothetical protein
MEGSVEVCCCFGTGYLFQACLDYIQCCGVMSANMIDQRAGSYQAGNAHSKWPPTAVLDLSVSADNVSSPH